MLTIQSVVARAVIAPLSRLFAQQAAISLPLMAVSPTASWFEYLDLAGAIQVDPVVSDNGTITAKGPGLKIAWDEKAVSHYAAV